MSRGVFQPVGQKRLTNIAVVRLKKGGMRFEIACYKNKVLDWRSGIETDLDEVLQTTTVFENVSKGVVAKDKDLERVFNSTDLRAICLQILGTGDIQVSEKERKVEQEQMFKDVAQIIVEKCVNPEDNVPYTVGMIERALRSVHFSVDLHKGAKQQALDAIGKLQAEFPIQRAKMLLQITVPESQQSHFEQLLRGCEGQVQNVTVSKQLVAGQPMVDVVAALDPEHYHQISREVGQVRGFSVVLQQTITGDAAVRLADDLQVQRPAPTPPQPVDASRTAMPAHSDARQPTQSSKGAGTKAKEDTRAAGGAVIYSRGPIAGVPEEIERVARRKKMFVELDDLQAGWTVELVAKGEDELIEATFYAPDGTEVGAFNKARRQAMQAVKGG